jgi:peptide-methionine (S)-S-oxide reductase
LQLAKNNDFEKATIGGGCFWCLDAIYRLVQGVESVVSGYCGGSKPSPTYKDICTGLTGHAEVVQISFNNKLISFDDILSIFFESHDPTTLNRQGADIGTQYRSIIFYHDANQEQISKNKISSLRSNYSDPIVTTIEPINDFYPAEFYHQNYYNLNPENSYCYYVIKPKIQKYLSKK